MAWLTDSIRGEIIDRRGLLLNRKQYHHEHESVNAQMKKAPIDDEVAVEMSTVTQQVSVLMKVPLLRYRLL